MRYYAPDGTYVEVEDERTYTKAEHEAALNEAVAKERYLWLLALGKTVTLDDAKAVEEWVHNRRETAARDAARGAAHD